MCFRDESFFYTACALHERLFTLTERLQNLKIQSNQEVLKLFGLIYLTHINESFGGINLRIIYEKYHQAYYDQLSILNFLINRHQLTIIGESNLTILSSFYVYYDPIDFSRPIFK